MFSLIGRAWYLIGIMDEVSPIAPGGEVFLSTGMQTYNAELSSYRGQIVSIAGVPEPSGLVLAGIGIGTALVAARRVRRRRACPPSQG